ncbi:hypothetical protein ACIKT0_01665 [Hansschlegelia beijingensis]|uniref:hypothetical protein n=1 Tax=Hansschlegelia beijingensis TaxID=1133344 RepID=UPI00387F2D8E
MSAPHTPPPLEVLFVSEDQSIIVGGRNNDDIAEFFHSGLATVGQSFDEALATA